MIKTSRTMQTLSLRHMAILFVFGGTIGPFCDGFHTHSDTLAYTTPLIFKMAWFAPLVMGLATVAMGNFVVQLDHFSGNHPTVPSSNRILGGLVLFGLQYFASGFLKLSPLAMIFYIGIFALAIWAVLDGKFMTLVTLCIPVGIAGSLTEISIIAAGQFHYLKPDFWGIPAWLPFLYVGAACVVKNMVQRLQNC